MAGITLAQAESMLAAYVAAETTILAGQSYRLGDRMMTRADLAAVQQGRKEWQATVANLASTATTGGVPGAIRARAVTPIT